MAGSLKHSATTPPVHTVAAAAAAATATKQFCVEHQGGGGGGGAGANNLKHTCADPGALEQIVDILHHEHVVRQQNHPPVLGQRPRRGVRQDLGERQHTPHHTTPHMSGSGNKRNKQQSRSIDDPEEQEVSQRKMRWRAGGWVGVSTCASAPRYGSRKLGQHGGGIETPRDYWIIVRCQRRVHRAL